VGRHFFFHDDAHFMQMKLLKLPKREDFFLFVSNLSHN